MAVAPLEIDTRAHRPDVEQRRLAALERRLDSCLPPPNLNNSNIYQLSWSGYERRIDK